MPLLERPDNTGNQRTFPELHTSGNAASPGSRPRPANPRTSTAHAQRAPQKTLAAHAFEKAGFVLSCLGLQKPEALLRAQSAHLV